MPECFLGHCTVLQALLARVAPLGHLERGAVNGDRAVPLGECLRVHKFYTGPDKAVGEIHSAGTALLAKHGSFLVVVHVECATWHEAHPLADGVALFQPNLRIGLQSLADDPHGLPNTVGPEFSDFSTLAPVLSVELLLCQSQQIPDSGSKPERHHAAHVLEVLCLSPPRLP